MPLTTTGDELTAYLRPTFFLDFDVPEVKTFADSHTKDIRSDTEKAVSLYYAVRDSFRYDPYHIDLNPDTMKASALLKRGTGYCIEKAAFLTTVGRAAGIPARLGFANVRNHIAVEKLVALLRTDVMVFHGFTEFFLNGKWVKATPAFNLTLCEKLNVAPLEFDGTEDSLFQQYDNTGQQYMEYVHAYGSFDDIPYDLFVSELKKHYPHLFDNKTNNESTRMQP